MSDTVSHSKIEMGSERSFGIVFAVVFALVALWPFIFGSGQIRIWAAVVAAVFALLTIVQPSVMAPLNKLWFKFGELLGMIIAPLIMALVFFVAVTPTGLLVRLFGRDLLRQKFEPEAKSYWIKRTIPMGTMKNQF